MQKTRIPVVCGKNLTTIQRGYRKKSGYVKILLDDETINKLFVHFARANLGKEPSIKRMYIVVEE